MGEFNFLKWLGHASFVFKEKDKVVYIDPFKITNASKKADIIFITHSHFNHLNMEDIDKVSKGTTKFVAPRESATKLEKRHVLAVEPNKEYEIDGIKFSTLPAYNTTSSRLDKHPKANGWVGYVIHTNGKSLYHAGDTEEVPEMAKIRVDLALLPMDGTYTMAVEQVIVAAKKMHAVHIAPMHYRRVLGPENAAKAERQFLKEIRNGLILEEEAASYSF